jgi:putative flippase GtrA
LLGGVIVRFGLVGIANTAVDYGVSLSLRYLLSAPEWASTAVGYVCGLACSYVLNGRFTFKAKGRILQFIAVNAVSMAASIALVQLFTLMNVPYWLGKGATVLVTMTVNFIGYRLWVYK